MKTFLQTLIFFLMLTQICFGQWYQQNPLMTQNNLYDVILVDENKGWAVGDSGLILKTTNDGINWIEQQSGVINKLNGVCFTNGNNGWIVGDNGTIISTINGGDNWVEQNSGVTVNLNEVSFCNQYNGLAVGEDATVLKTTDGGNNWISQTLPNITTLYGVYLLDANIGWVVGHGVRKTTNGGQTWVMQYVPNIDFCYDVFFTDENNGWIAADRILRTTNGGTDWTYGDGFLQGLRSVHFADLDNGLTAGDNGRIFKTSNRGINWTQIYETPHNVNAVCFRNIDKVSIVGNIGTILNSTDGGNNWFSPLGGSTNHWNGVSFRDDNNGIVIGNYGKMMITSNGGSSWMPLLSGTTQNLNDIEFIDENNGWIVGGGDYWPSTAQAVILKTTNGGLNWFQQFTDTNYFLNAVYFVDANTGWAVGSCDSIILKTTNGGTDWTYQPINIDFEFTPTFNDVHFINADTGFVAGGNIAAAYGDILYTTNGGNLWLRQNSASGNIDWLVISFLNDLDGIAVGWSWLSLGKIYRTIDGGENWQFVLEHSLLVFNCVTYIDSINAWTAGSGYYEGSVIYYSSDKGLTWTSQIDSGLYSNSLKGICFINSTTGWAVGENGFILHTTNGGVPVELKSFTATTNGNAVILNWSTATEINNSGFSIERKSSCSEYSEIGFVPGFGTTTEPKAYSYTDSKVSSGKYKYRFKQIDFDGSYKYSQEVEVEVSAPLQFTLEQNFPNPFNPSTVIGYQLPVSSDVTLKVFDILGNEIVTLVNEYKPTGKYAVEFNPASDNLYPASGIYFYQLKAGEYTAVKKMILIK